MSKHMSNRVLWAIVVCILAGIQTSLRASPLLTETAKLTPNDNPNTPHFGNSVDISNDYIVIGAPFDNKELGAIYVFQRMGGNWEQQIKLVASDGVNEDHFGWSTAIDGDWIVVGAPRNNFFAGFGDGKAYVFHRVGNSWTEHTKLISSGGFNDFDYGTAVDISGNVIVCSCKGGIINTWSCLCVSMERNRLDRGSCVDRFGYTGR